MAFAHAICAGSSWKTHHRGVMFSDITSLKNVVCRPSKPPHTTHLFLIAQDRFNAWFQTEEDCSVGQQDEEVE